MPQDLIRIGVVAPSSPLPREDAAAVAALVGRLYPDGRVEVAFHPQCFLEAGHFAGDDEARARALLEIANDPAFDAVWFGRGGYGSCRVAEQVLDGLGPAARDKAYMGYSDAGAVLSGLKLRGIGRPVHGPMPRDICRTGGDAAVARALAWLVDRDPGVLEPSLRPGQPATAYNLAILTSLIGTPLQPDLEGQVLMLEEVSEHMYRIDRMMFQLTSTPAFRTIAGIRLGRCSDVPENDPPFGQDEVEVVKQWCARAGIAYLGRADIGHDADNKVVPYGGI